MFNSILKLVLAHFCVFNFVFKIKWWSNHFS